MLRLVATFEGRVQQFPLPAGRMATIGSSRDNDFVIAWPGVSRRHATVVRSGDNAVIRDVGSKNRLIFRGQRRDSIELAPGDVVQIGRARLLLERISSSDARLAMAIDMRPSSSAGTASRSTTGSVERQGGPEEALRWAREAEKSDASRRRRLLDWAREIAGAHGFVVGHREGDDLALQEIIGSVAGKHVFEVHLEGHDFFIAHLERPLSAWQREFLEYVAARMFPRPAKEPPRPMDDELSYPDEMVIGDSPAIRALLQRIQQMIGGDLHVLLRGERGSGKELFARMIHQSRRPGAPFKAVNCAAIPADLVEAELFGIKAGVATGVDRRNGLFIDAGNGTVFLDEIGDLPLKLQGKILRVLQEREVQPLGTSVPLKVNAQVITSTNKDLQQMVREGTFRADLYDRLKGLEFVILPLREHREDLPHYVVAFAQRAAAASHKRIRGVSEKALAQLAQYDWPGNIRELKTAVDRAVLLCPNGGALETRHFDLPREPAPTVPSDHSVDLVSREIEAIHDALRRTSGNKAAAARLLGITRPGLYVKMKRYGIRRNSY